MRARHTIAIVAPLCASGCILATDLGGFSAGTEDAGTPMSESGAADAGLLVDGQPASVVEAAAPDAAKPTFLDDFNRGSGSIGNGWVEGQPGVYLLKENVVHVLGAALDYTESWLLRPKAESLRDVTASVEFTPTGVPPQYPQVHVRANGLSGAAYKAYGVGIPEDTKQLFFVRAEKGNTTTLASVGLSEDIAIGRTYRLSITTTGELPVKISAKIERLDDAGFRSIGTAAAEDTEGVRIGASGQAGISANGVPNYRYDNFTVTSLQP